MLENFRARKDIVSTNFWASAGENKLQIRMKMNRAEMLHGFGFHKSCGFFAAVSNGSSTLRPPRADS